MSVARAESKSDASSEPTTESTSSRATTRRGDASSTASIQGQELLRQGGPAVGLPGKSTTDDLGIQPKLTVNEPNDKYEKEAERVADAVMRKPEPELEGIPRSDDRIEDNASNRRVLTEESAVQQIASLKGGGKPLSEPIRSFFEPRFEEDFGDVRVHTGPSAEKVARALNAKALTHGRAIILGQGSSDVAVHNDRKTLAHELTHVVQQKRTLTPDIQRQDGNGAESTDTGRGTNRVSKIVVRATKGRVMMVMHNGERYSYRLTENKLPPGNYTARGERNGFVIDAENPNNNLPSKFSNRRNLIRINTSKETASEAPSPGEMTFADTMDVTVTTSGPEAPEEERSSQSEAADDKSARDRKSRQAEPADSGKESTQKQKLDVRPVVKPTKLELPEFIPAYARKAIQTGDYSALQEYKKGDGLYRIPDAGDGPFGDVIIYRRDVGSGYRVIEAFQMFPNRKEYYRKFAEGSEFQAEVYYDSFTWYNSRLWKYVSSGMSITRARAQVQKDANERLKTVFMRAATLFELAHAGMGMAAAAGRWVRSVVSGGSKSADEIASSGAKSADEGSSSTKLGKSTETDEGGLFFAETTVEKVPSLKNNVRGITDWKGNIKISTEYSPSKQEVTYYHEWVHSVLSPKLKIFRKQRAKLNKLAYHRSDFLKALEEMMAESYAQLKTRGIKGLPDGIRFPFKGGYDITLHRVVTEAAAGTITIGGTTYGVYVWSSGGSSSQEIRKRDEETKQRQKKP